MKVQTDILAFASTVPEVLEVGCNKGAVNTFSPLDVAALTNGAYTAQQAAADPVCFASQFALAEVPLITGVSGAPLTTLVNQLSSTLSGQNCAAIKSINQSALTACPGFSFYGGITGPVAPGAIQS